MSGSLNIYPFEDTETTIRYGVQVLIFLVGLALTHKLIIKPCLRLHNERKKRTVGNSINATNKQKKINELEQQYFESLKKVAEEAKAIRLNEIKLAQKTANEIITQNQQKAAAHIDSITHTLELERKKVKNSLPSHADEIVNQIFSRFGLNVLFVALGLSSLFISKTSYAASNENTSLIQSFWYSIFWPYFQFAIFIVAIIYFAKTPITEFLHRRREQLKVKLSEAHEALNSAEQKLKEYELKISSLQHEAEELKKQNLLDAKIERDKIILEANKFSEGLLKEAERTALEMITKSNETIKSEIFNLALREIENKLTPDKLEKLESLFKDEVVKSIRTMH